MRRIKWLFLWLLVFLAAGASAQNTTLTGTFVAPGNSNFSGYMWLSLPAPAVVISGCSGGPAYVLSLVPIVVTISNGSMVGTNKVWGADCLNPASIPYNVVIKDLQNNTLVTDQWLISGSTFNIGTAQSTVYPPPATGGSGGGLSPPLFAGAMCFSGGTSTYHCSAADINSLTGSFNINNLGNSATATAFASTPTVCSPGQVPQGVDINGNAVGCSAVSGVGVSSLNSLTGGLSLVGDSTISVTPGGTSINLHVLGASGLSGQTTNCLPKATSATASTISSALCDAGGTVTVTEPFQVNDGSGSSTVTFLGGTLGSGLAGSAVVGTDSSGNLYLSENNATMGRLCSANNGQCISATPSVAWTVNSGAAATPAAAYLISPIAGTISHCYFITTTSDGSTNLVFNVKLAGTNIINGTNATVTAGTSGGTVSTFSLTSGTISVAAGNSWELDISTGTSSWIGAVQCY